MTLKSNGLGNLSSVERFTEGEFISILLPNLYKRGVRIITEDELSKKLYAYYINPEYRRLFLEVAKDRAYDKVDIYEGMAIAKDFSGCIGWTSDRPQILHLNYGQAYDISEVEKNKDSNIIKLVHKIADQLSLRYEIEHDSPIKLDIYGFDPNTEYKIVNGRKHSDIYRWELITDGHIIKSRKVPYSVNNAFADPNGHFLSIGLSEYESKNIVLKKASYVIMQGIINDRLKKINVYTTLLDSEKLRKISEYANQIYNNSSKEKTFIKRLSLK